MTIMKIGERVYEFRNLSETIKAQDIYAKHVGDQNIFEEKRIEFVYEVENV